MPRFIVSVYRNQTFKAIIDAEDESDAAMQMTCDNDIVWELMKDHPEDIRDGDWNLNYIEEVD